MNFCSKYATEHFDTVDFHVHINEKTEKRSSNL